MIISAARELGPLGHLGERAQPRADRHRMDDRRDPRRTSPARSRSAGSVSPADVAEIVAFLVSPAGRWVSGQLLHADGGFSARY